MVKINTIIYWYKNIYKYLKNLCVLKKIYVYQIIFNYLIKQTNFIIK